MSHAWRLPLGILLSSGSFAACTPFDYSVDETIVPPDLEPDDSDPPTIEDVAEAPTISVESSPTACDGDDLTLELTVADDEDLPQDVTIQWTSDLDGLLAEGVASADGTATYTSNALSVGEHTITVTAVDTDGLEASETFVATVASRPTMPTVAVVPDPAYTDDLLAFEASEQDGVELDAQWRRDGVPYNNDATVEASATTKGEVWTVVVTPVLGSCEGPSAEAQATIENSAPTLTTATVDGQYATDPLHCSGDGFADADGDADASWFEWSIDGSPVGAGADLGAGAFAVGDTVTCTVTPHDGDSAGIPVSASVIIENRLPGASVSLTPDPAYTNDVLVADTSAIDADGDPVDLSYTWYVNGALLTGEVGDTLDGANAFAKDDLVVVVVTPSDPHGSGIPESASLTVANSPPTAPVVAITPADPYEGDSLTCTVVVDSTDPDDTGAVTPTYLYEWSKNGVGTTDSGPTIAGTETHADDVWECVVRRDDNGTPGDPGSDTVTILSDCTDPADWDPEPLLALNGLEADGLGVAAWNTNGSAPEPARTGHHLGAIHPCMTGYYAYYYLASRNYVDATSVGALAGISLTGLPLTSAAMTTNGYTADQLVVTTGLSSLGADTQGVDWSVAGSVETREYSGGSFQISLAGEDLLLVASAPITVTIDYGGFCNPADDTIAAYVDYVYPVDASSSSSAGVRAVAEAFLDDLAGRGVRFDFGALTQPAVQTAFTVGGRTGAYFDAMSADGEAEPFCE